MWRLEWRPFSPGTPTAVSRGPGFQPPKSVWPVPSGRKTQASTSSGKTRSLSLPLQITSPSFLSPPILMELVRKAPGTSPWTLPRSSCGTPTSHWEEYFTTHTHTQDLHKLEKKSTKGLIVYVLNIYMSWLKNIFFVSETMASIYMFATVSCCSDFYNFHHTTKELCCCYILVSSWNHCIFCILWHYDYMIYYIFIIRKNKKTKYLLIWDNYLITVDINVSKW